MMNTPLLNKLLAYYEEHPQLMFLLGEDKTRTCGDVARELRMVLTTAKKKTPHKKLRSYKGVTYEGDSWWFGGQSYAYAASIIAFQFDEFSDEDFDAIYALKSDPYEPVEGLDDLLEEFARKWVVTAPNVEQELVDTYADRIRRAVNNEPVV